MHTNQKKLLPFIFFAFTMSASFGQVLMQDSRGKDLLEMYKGGALQATFVPSQVSMQVNYNFVIGSPYFFYVNGDTTQKTISASQSFSLTGKITGSGANLGKPYNVNNGLVRPAYKIEVGYQRNLNTFYDISRVPSSYLFTYTAGANFFAEYQNVNFYDTGSRTVSNKRPLLAGIHAHVTFFEPKGGWLAVSFSGDFGKSYNQASLTPFQQRTTDIYIDENITGVGDVFGNIGAFDPVAAYRFRMSVPVFIMPWVSLTPYWSVYGNTGDQASWLPGFALNFLNGKPATRNGSIVQGFGIGVDWQKSSGKWTSPNYSLYGSLNLDLLKKTIAPATSTSNTLL